jgi:tetratricopeptide (TPR) repeat protein
MVIAAIVDFVVKNTETYLFKKGLDTLFSSSKELNDELRKVIYDTLDEYETKFPQANQGAKFPFYHSQKIIDELLKFRIMHQDDYRIQDLYDAMDAELNVITPTKENIEDFYRIFLDKIDASKELKKLEIKKTFENEVFIVSQKLDDLKRHIENLFTNSNADLELQWKDRIESYIKTLQSFKPATALSLIDALLKSFDESNRRPSPELLAVITYQKGVCLRFLNRKNEYYKAFLNAYELNPQNIALKEQASFVFYKLGDSAQSLKLANELLAYNSFNAIAWAVKILNTNSIEFEAELGKVPSLVKTDIVFLKTLFNSLNNDKQYDKVNALYALSVLPELSEYKPIAITINTYSEVIFWINLTIQRFFGNFYCDFKEIDESNNPTILLLNTLLNELLNKLDGTEISEEYHDLRFLRAYTEFSISPDKGKAMTMKEAFEKLPKKSFLNIVLTANGLQFIGLNDLAIALLEKENRTETEALLLQAHCYTKDKNLDKYDETVRLFLRSFSEYNPTLITNALNTLVQMSFFQKLGGYTVEDFVGGKSFESEQDQLFIRTTAELLIDGRSDELIGKFDAASKHVSDPVIQSLIALTYFQTGDYDRAVEQFKMFYDDDASGREAYYFILALNHSKKNSKTLLEHLANWRVKFPFQPELVKLEIQLRRDLLQWKTCIVICQYYLENEPNDEFVLLHYLLALNEDGTPESKAKIKDLAIRLRDFDFQVTDNIKMVSQILIQNDLFEDGLEILYKYTRKDFGLSHAYFMACVQCQRAGKMAPLREFQEVVEGSFVKYERNGKIYFVELTEQNLKNPFNKEFLGCFTNGAFVTQRPITGEDEVITIKRVMNKFLSLHDEILEKAHDDPFSGTGLTSFQFDPETPENIVTTLQRLFGKRGKAAQISKEQVVKQYYAGTLSFTEAVVHLSGNDFLGTYYFLAQQKDGIVSIPMSYLTAKMSADTEFVIDMSSLAMLYQLDSNHKTIYGKKFVISGYLIEKIKKAMGEESSNNLPSLSLSVTSDAVIPDFNTESRHENNTIYLKGLLKWIDENCLVEVSERVTDFTRGMNIDMSRSFFTDYALNTILLVEDNENRILLTDDLIYIKHNLLPLNRIVSTERFTKQTFGEDYVGLYEFIKNKYRGFSVSERQLNDEYLKSLTGQVNYYSSCLDNISLMNNPGLSVEVIKHVKAIALHPLISHEKLKFDQASIFVNLLRGVDTNVRRHIEKMIRIQFQLLGEKMDLVFEALQMAYDILDS